MPELDIHRQAQAVPAGPILERAAFQGTKGGSVRRLSGWRPSHIVPKEHNSFTRAFVQRISEEELTERLEGFYTRIKDAFGYKRKQVATSQEVGFATCKTPDFSLELSIGIDPEDPARYLETVCVTGIRSLETLASEAFASVFDRQFSQVVFEYSQGFGIERLIDLLEERNDPALRLHYPPDASRCTVELVAEDARMVFSGCEMRFVADGNLDIRSLARALVRGHELLAPSGIEPFSGRFPT